MWKTVCMLSASAAQGRQKRWNELVFVEEDRHHGSCHNVLQHDEAIPRDVDIDKLEGYRNKQLQTWLKGRSWSIAPNVDGCTDSATFACDHFTVRAGAVRMQLMLGKSTVGVNSLAEGLRDVQIGSVWTQLAWPAKVCMLQISYLVSKLQQCASKAKTLASKRMYFRKLSIPPGHSWELNPLWRQKHVRQPVARIGLDRLCYTHRRHEPPCWVFWALGLRN
eukprot:5702490-Amphidinium_carterae.2